MKKLSILFISLMLTSYVSQATGFCSTNGSSAECHTKIGDDIQVGYFYMNNPGFLFITFENTVYSPGPYNYTYASASWPAIYGPYSAGPYVYYYDGSTHYDSASSYYVMSGYLVLDAESNGDSESKILATW